MSGASSENTEIGTVISSMTGPSPSELDFVVTKGTVHRGQFVEMEYSEGTLVALVTNVLKTNRYFERADSVKEFEANGRKMLDQFPTTEWEYLLAQTRPLGVFSAGMIKRATFPPSPGTRVCIASADKLQVFLGFDVENGMRLGEIENHGLSVRLSMSRLLKKHLAVLAMSGSGKSVCVKSIIEEVICRRPEQGRLAVIVMDPHGEYTNFAIPSPSNGTDYSSKTRVVKGRDVRLGVPHLDIGLIASMVSGLSSPQQRELKKILSSLFSEMKSGMGPFDFSAVKTAILSDKEMKSETQKILLSWIMTLEDMHLFSKTDLPSISDLTKPGQLTVVDLSDIVDMKKKQVIVGYFAKKLFYGRVNKRVPPFLLVVEEAHQFAPERAKEERAISKHIIETISREGRKFGASLCLVSQRPINLSTTALANCGTHIILRITNPYDLKHIGESSEGIDSQSERMITSLRVGEALLVGEAVNYPMFFKVRKNNSAPSKHETTLEEACREFEENQAVDRTEAEAFL